MTTEDRAYEAAARVLVDYFDLLPDDLQPSVTEHAKQIVTAFLTAIGQEVQ